MKYLLKNVALATTLLCFFNCTTESLDNTDSQQLETPTTMTCSGEDPKARIINNGNINVSFEIYNDIGTLIASEYDLGPDETSSWSTFSTGNITFVVSNAQGQKSIEIDMNYCMVYEMEIGANNQLTSNQAQQL